MFYNAGEGIGTDGKELVNWLQTSARARTRNERNANNGGGWVNYTHLIQRHTLGSAWVVHGGEAEERPAQLARVLPAVLEPLQQAVLVGVPFVSCSIHTKKRCFREVIQRLKEEQQLYGAISYHTFHGFDTSTRLSWCSGAVVQLRRVRQRCHMCCLHATFSCASW